jgi:UDP-glucose 4-epimerase
VEEFCREHARDWRFDRIYHLASVVGPVGVLGHAGRIAKSILDDAYRLMDLAMAMDARLLDVSTSEVYGGGRDGYCSEKDSKIIPPKVSVRLEYAVAKMAAEVALINTSRTASLDVVIVRPFNIAGPRQSGKGGFVLPRFIAQAMENEPLTVYYRGDAVRAFTHVKDVARGIALTMERGERGDVYNIGNPKNKTTILDLAKRVLRIVPGESQVSFVDPKTLFGDLFEEANDKYPDADRAMSVLGWTPTRDIDTIISETYEYMKAKACD